jgi:D-threonate/D-erythronate kinase
MIIVVADDFTGASEMAGIALEHGLSVRIQTKWSHIIEPCDVLVIDTNSRSLGITASGEIMDQVMHLVQDTTPDFLFKKTDSVLRGNVKQELETVIKYNPGKSVLLVPANPSMGRTIHEGVYFVEGAPIHESIFSQDPECPARVSDVIQLINKSKTGDDVKLISPGQEMEAGTIYIPAHIDNTDVNFWAKHLKRNIIAAGAADFFRAVLHERGERIAVKHLYQFNLSDIKSLIVCGSSLSNLFEIQTQMSFLKPHIIELTGEQVCFEKSSGMAHSISGQIVRSLNDHQTVVLMVNKETRTQEHVIRKLPSCLAAVVYGVMNTISVDELFIEGGTSSSEIVRKLGWNCFEPTHVVSEGIIRMNVPIADVHLTVKPGSYRWPAGMWFPKINNQQTN